MSRDGPPIETDAEFADALLALVRRAHFGGVDVEGGWDCRTEAELPDWDVVVTEVETTASSETARTAGDPEAVDD